MSFVLWRISYTTEHCSSVVKIIYPLCNLWFRNYISSTVHNVFLVTLNIAPQLFVRMRMWKTIIFNLFSLFVDVFLFLDEVFNFSECFPVVCSNAYK